MIRWFARNDIAANFLLIGILFAGVLTAIYRIPLEVRPAWVFNDIYIGMDYRGGTAKDVERAIIIPIEKALADLPSVAKIRSNAARGRATLWIGIRNGEDMRDALAEIESRVDAITTFPDETERPRIAIPNSNNWREVLTVAVMGDLAEDELVRAATRVRDDLIELDGISQAKLEGVRPYEIAIEAHQDKLRSFNIGFAELTEGRSSLDMPAGSIESPSGNLVVRTKGQAYTRADFERIPVRAAGGAEVLLGEVATVIDGFEENRQLVRFNGEPALMVEVMRHDKESAIAISKTVRDYVATASQRFPQGIKLAVWNDESISISGRLETLGWSLLQGCALVFLLLSLFLRPALAFWVVIGIPASFAGGVLLMPLFGVSANLMSVFGFIIVLGLVVDDAIITGENIFFKLKSGMDPLEASVLGAKEVAVPVTFGVLTTVVAFLPLLFFPGHWGSYARQIPPIVAPVLLFSLIESKLILPSHLKHLKVGRTKLNPFTRLQKRVSDSLELFVEKIYSPSLNFATRHRYSVISSFIAIALLMFGYCKGGNMRMVAMPTVDRPRITADIDLPHDTSLEKTDLYVRRIAAAAEILRTEFTDGQGGPSLIRNIYTETGDDGWFSSPVDPTEGRVAIEVTPPSIRSEPGPKNSVIAMRWTELIGEIPEASSIRVRGESNSRHTGARTQEPIEIELRGKGSETTHAIAQQIVDLLESYDGISDAWTKTRGGEDELEITLKPRAAELGLTQQSLGTQIRQAFFGQEAQRVQRGNDNIRVMVRLTQRERRSLHTLDTLKIRTPEGGEVSLSTVADVKRVKSPGKIERIDGSEAININALPQSEEVDIIAIAKAAAPEIQQLVNRGDDLSFRFTGYIADNEESKRRTLIGSIALLFALYALLAIPFKSLVQPVFVLLAVPFGIIGALLGHLIMGITPSYLSIFGMLALAGVVVNDSLVMVDYINRRRREGVPLRDAVLAAGARRFRPILLTSITTFAGLMPLIFDRSLQAQFLIPMAVSLGFGILFATTITLYLIPCSYLISSDLGHALTRAKNWYLRPFATRSR